MSVLARFRKVSKEEYFRTAQKIQDELTKTLLSRKVVPEELRDIFTYPTLNLCQEFLDTLLVGGEGISYIDKIFGRLQYLVQTLYVDEVVPTQIEQICILLLKEEALLGGSR